MKRARDELLAGARLARYEHGEVELGHALKLGKHLAHRDGAPHEIVEAVVGAEGNLHHARGGLDLQRGLPHPHARPEGQHHLAQPYVAEEAAVGAPEVAQHPAAFDGLHLRVGVAHRAVVEVQVAHGAAADDHPRRGHLVDAPAVGAVDHHPTAPSQAPRRRAPAEKHGLQPAAFGARRGYAHAVAAPASADARSAAMAAA